MNTILTATLALVATVTIYLLALQLHKRFRHPLLNPVLVTLLILVVGLLVFDIPYARYNEGGRWLTMLLDPAVVALGVPLYQQVQHIRKDLPKLILVSVLSALLAIVSTVALALWLGAEEELAISLAPRSITTPIAVVISGAQGGDPALTAIAVLITGLIGAMFGIPLLSLFRINSAKSEGVAIGIASHALGTAAVMDKGPQQGAYSALSLVLCAIATALLAPLLVPLLLQWLA